MKKNITINLCGRLFNIDEDAYELLRHYIDTLRSYFAKQEGGEEIADDIETRIAELLEELKNQGTEAVNIDHIKEIIHRIGKPEEMDGYEGTNDEKNDDDGHKYDSFQSAAKGALNNVRERTKGKRLYRDPNDKKMMGVLSGFANYFGGDVVWWRLGYTALVLLCFTISAYNFLWFMRNHWLYVDMSLWGVALIIAYVILAIIMPVAESPEDRLRMKGKEVNPQNLAEELAPLSSPVENTGDESSANQEAEAPSESQKRESKRRESSGCISTTFGCIGGIFTALWTVVTTLFRWCIYAFGAFIAVMCLLGMVILMAFALNPEETIFKRYDFFQTADFATIIPSLTLPFYIFIVASVLVLAITAYAIIHSLLNELRQMPSMPYRQRIFLLVTWFLGLLVAGVTLAYGIPILNNASDEYYDKKYQNWFKKEDPDHYSINTVEQEYLQQNGWWIVNAVGCNNRFTAVGEYYVEENRWNRYLDCYDEHSSQRYRVEHIDTVVMPGEYKLHCAARANGRGAFVYLLIGDKKELIEIPATGNTGGSIWEQAKAEWNNLYAETKSGNITPKEAKERKAELQQKIKANNGKGYGWNTIWFKTVTITEPNTVVRYGLTSDPDFTGQTWLGQYFSACDFVIVKID